MKKVSLVFVGMLALLLGTAPSASAVSVFDNVIHSTSTMEVKRNGVTKKITSNYIELATDCSRWTSTSSSYAISCSNFVSKLNTALGNGSGWFVAQRTAKIAFSIGDQNLSTGDKYVALGVNDSTNNNGLFTTAESTGGLFLKGSGPTCAVYVALTAQSALVVATVTCTAVNGEGSQISVRDDYWLWTSRLLFANTSISYPVDYEGAIAEASEEWADLDGDGLLASEESAQETSNTNSDTDSDGLSDFIESQWNPDRNDVFCGNSCAYPNPTQKDLYVEADWINENSTVYKPSPTQLANVVDTYEDQNILAHFDTGQYGCGGQIELSDPLIFAPTENELDFYDLKNGTTTTSAYFNPIRKNIWHYMITSPNFMLTEIEQGGTGASYAGDDDSMVSIEKIEDLNPVNLDMAISGTILRELGHNLCLSSESSQYYPNQPSECIYPEIDKPIEENPSTDYVSVMNYLFQLNTTDYSHGVNGMPDDHDDWQAISLGMGDFTQSVFEWGDSQSQQRSYRHNSNSTQPTIQDMIDNIQS